MSFAEEAEEKELFRQKTQDNFSAIFATAGSAGNNSAKLAQLVTAFDGFIHLMGWQDKPLAKLSSIVLSYQASTDTKYHNDFKDILIAEEVEKKKSQRKGSTTNLSIM